MKKLSLLALSLLTSPTLFAATVRIHNKTGSKIYAQINNAKRASLAEQDLGKDVLEGTLGALAIIAPPVMFSGNTPVTLGKQIRGEFNGKVPNMKAIEPGSSTFFNSGFSPIKKVHFAQIAKTTTKTLSKSEFQDLYEKVASKHGIAIIGRTTADGKVFAKVPTIKIFTYNLGSDDIGTMTTEARIDVIKWGKAKRIKRKVFGIF